MSRRCNMCQVFTSKSYRRLQLNSHVRLTKVRLEFVGEILTLSNSIVLCRTCYDVVISICDVDSEIAELNTSQANCNKKREEPSHKIACRIVKKFTRPKHATKF